MRNIALRSLSKVDDELVEAKKCIGDLTGIKSEIGTTFTRTAGGKEKNLYESKESQEEKE